MSQLRSSGSWLYLLILFLGLVFDFHCLAAQEGQSSEASPTETKPGDVGSKASQNDQSSISLYAKKISARKHSRLSAEMVDLFAPLVSSVSPSTVRIFSGKDQIAIGTVIAADGFVLTVASELKTDMQCRLPDGTSQKAAVFGVDQESGLALLKVEAQGLLPLTLSPNPVPLVGSWIASVSPDPVPAALGVVSVPERKIVGGGAFIGIRQSPSANNARGVLIDEVTYDSPAYKADIRIGDRIVLVAGTEVKTMLDIQRILRDKSPGDELEITLLRSGQEQTVRLILAARDKFDTLLNEQDRMGSVLSKRRQGFTSAFQHDSFIQARDCGSPLLDLNGQVVGINVSRSGRVSSLALPLHVVIPAVERLRSGQLAPEIINAKRIAQVAAELDSLLKEMDPLNSKLGSSEQDSQKHEDKIQALKSVQADLEKKLQEMLATQSQQKDEVKQLRKRMAEIQVKTKKLKDELEALKTGANSR